MLMEGMENRPEPASREKKLLLWDWGFFGVLLAAYTAITFYLFYHQAIGNEQWFHSDIKAYMLEMQGLESGYEFPYPLFFRFGAFFQLFFAPEPAITVALTILNSAGVVILKLYLNRILGRACDGCEDRAAYWKRAALLAGISMLTLALFFVSMLFSVTGQSLPGLPRRYKGVFSPNPYHNATYLATRPFAILCFFQFAELLETYEKNFSWKKGMWFALSLFLTTITKPSFTFVLVGTAGLIMLYRLAGSRFRAWGPAISLGLCFVPTFCALLYQFLGVFGPREGEETGVGFGWLEAWGPNCDNIPLAILVALAFPVLVLLIHAKELKTDTLYRFSVQLLLVSLVMVMVLYEKGFRKPDMNFSWGYMHGMFFAFVGAAIVLARATLGKTKKWFVLAPEWLLFFCHLGCGLLYFKNSLAGFLYY